MMLTTLKEGNLEKLKDHQKQKLLDYLNRNDLPKTSPYMIDGNGKIKISKEESHVIKFSKTNSSHVEELLCVVWIGGSLCRIFNQTGFDIKKTLDDLKKNR